VDPVPYGSGVLLQNSRCGVLTWMSSISGSGNTLTLTLAMQFLGEYPGARTIYMRANNGADSGWIAKGTYTVTNNLPSVIGGSPNSGSGWNQTFTFNYSDADGAEDIFDTQVQFKPRYARELIPAQSRD
jgi:hypothetical protein